MAKSRTANVVRNSSASMMNKIIQMVVQFVMRTVFIRFLGNEYTGVSGLFTDILHVLSLMELGLDSSMVYSLYKPLLNKDRQKTNALLNFYRKAFNIIGAIVLAAGICITPFINHIVKDVPNITEDIHGIFLMYVMTSGLSYFLIYKTILLRADQKAHIIYIVNSIVAVAEMAAEIVLLLVFKKFYAYLIMRLVATMASNLILSYITSKKYADFFNDRSASISEDEKKSLFKDLACLTVYNLSGVVINSTDSIFISALIGTVEVAIVGNFTLIINSIRTAVNQVVIAAKPSIGNLAVSATPEKQENVFNIMNFLFFCISCLCSTCLMVLLNPFVSEIWFRGDKYRIAVGIIALLVINFHIAVMVFPVESFRTANGLFVQGWMRPAVMAVMNIVLDMVFGKLWGIAGIFLATTISRLLTQVWFDPYLIYKMVFKKSPMKYFFIYLMYAAVTAASCAAAYLLADAVPIGNIYLCFIYKMAVSVTVPVVIIVVLFHKTEGFRYVIDNFSKIKKKLLKKKSA